MSAHNETPDRIKRLFSSFLTRDSGLTTDTESNTNDDTSQKRTNNGDFSVPDARNKRLFFERVNTFSPLTWFAKPLELSPLVCAQYGWQNTDTDMLQCVNCRAFVCGQLPQAVDSENYRDSCNKLKKELIEGHEKLCKWSSSPCPVSFLCVPHDDKEELLSDFLFRMTSVQCVKIPSLSFKSVEEKGVTQEKMMSYARTIGAKSNVEEVPSESAIVCALCGWHYSEAEEDILQCKFCCRKLGLWHYQFGNTEQKTSVESDTLTAMEADSVKENKINGNTSLQKTNGCACSDQTNSNYENISENGCHCGSSETTEIPLDKDTKKMNGDTDRNNETNSDCDGPVKKRPRLEVQTFDPVTEHRYWCPWLQTGSINTSSAQMHGKETSPAVSPLKSQTMSAKLCNEGEPAWLKVTKILCQRLNDDNDDDDNDGQLKRSPQVEGLRHLRKVLRECTSPTKVQ